MSQADLLARLEAVTGRLERLAGKIGSGGAGGGDDDDDVPQYVTDLQNVVNTNLPKVAAACNDLGIKGAEILKQGYDNIVDLVSRVPKSKKPSPQELTAFLKSGIAAIGDADTLKFKGKDFKNFGDHYKAIYEATAMISWVTMSPPMGTPFTHINSQKDATDFNLLRIQKNKKDDKNKAFVKAFQDLNKAMTEYGKQYFKKDGLVWNPKGSALSDAPAAAAPAATGGATEQKEAPKKAAAGDKKAGGGMAGVFGQLNQGLNVTSGLKKVKKSQKTKYRKDRSGKVEMKAAPKKAGRKKGAEAIKYVGGRWMMENHNEGVYECPKADMKSNVYITMGDGATYNLQGLKVKSITVDSCNKCRVFIHEVVSTVEVVNCKSVTLVVTKKAPSISIDKSSSPRIILQKEAFDNKPDIYTSNISAMNIEVPGATENDDPIEIPVPEQFLTRIDCKTKKASTTEVTHG